jgi:hypothetical protein
MKHVSRWVGPYFGLDEELDIDVSEHTVFSYDIGSRRGAAAFLTPLVGWGMYIKCTGCW